MVSSPFVFLIFFNMVGFPYELLDIDMWYAYLSHFCDDDQVQYLIEFHNYIPKMGVHHEYVLMKLFMMSLESDGRKWYRQLPSGRISSLK